MNQTEQRLFSNRQLIRLIIPLIIEQGLSILVGMCDGMMVSSAGEAAISGVSLVDMINAIILNLFAALATGGAVVTSQYLGAKRMDKARQSAGQLVLMASVLGVDRHDHGLGHAALLLHPPLLLRQVDHQVQAGLNHKGLRQVPQPFSAIQGIGLKYMAIEGINLCQKLNIPLTTVWVESDTHDWPSWDPRIPGLLNRLEDR